MEFTERAGQENLLTGRQLLWLMYDSFRTDETMARVFTILLIKVLSFLFATVLVCFPFRTEPGIRAGTGLDEDGLELETLEHRTGEILGSNVPREVDIGVEDLIDTPSCEEASKNSSSEVQTVQLDIERWYLLFENTNSATFFLSWPTSSFRMTTLAAASP